MADTVQVLGLKALQDKLKELDERVAKNAMRRAVAAGGRVFRDLMRQKAPRDKGDLAKGIGVSTRADTRTGTFTAKIRPSKKTRPGNKPAPIYEALWNEFGVKPHEIRAKGGVSARDRNKALKLLGGAFAASVAHPGIAPAPFMRPAADEAWPKALEVFKQILSEAIDQTAKK